MFGRPKSDMEATIADWFQNGYVHSDLTLEDDWQDGLREAILEYLADGEMPQSEALVKAGMIAFEDGMRRRVAEHERLYPRENARDNGAEVPRDFDGALDLWHTFNQREQTTIGEFESGMRIPERVVILGAADHVLYKSTKRDPETWKVPSGKGVNYIHEHDDGVRIGVPLTSPLVQGQRKTVRVPDFIRNAKTLARLGKCLGLGLRQAGGVVEIDAKEPMPELYAIASGKALLVIQSKRKVEAVIWGGRLDVEARGIVH